MTVEHENQDAPHADRDPAGDAWGPCVSGEIDGMIRRRRSRSRMLSAAALVSGASVVLVAVGLSTWFTRPQGYVYGGIDCGTCQANADDYFSGTPLDPELVASMRAHLAACPVCGPHFHDRTRRNSSSASTEPVYVPVAMLHRSR